MNCKSLLIQFLKKHKLEYFSGVFLLVFSTLISTYIPKIIGQITDGLNDKSMDKSQILKSLAIMMAIVVSYFVLKFVWRYLLLGNCRNIEVYLRDKLFAHLQTLPVSFFTAHKTGDLVAYAINDIQAVRMIFGFGFIAIVEGLAINIISLSFMAQTINPRLTVLALLPVPISIFLITKLRLTIRKRFLKVQKAFSIISEKVQENVMGIRVIKSFAQEDLEMKAFEKFSKDRLDAHMNMVKVSALLAPATQLLFGISFSIFILYGSRLVIEKTITIGDFVAFNTYLMLIMGPLVNIARIIEVWQKGLASINRLDEIFRAEPTTVFEVTDPEPIEKIDGDISIRDLSFSYPGFSKKVLKNISLDIKKGTTLGILGRTGSGKTTLISVLLRLYDIEDGHIFIDDRDINKIPADILRENIGVVPQDNFLFSTTIKNNIEFFRGDFSEDDVIEAAKMAGVYDNIVGFPDGFDTMVGERGMSLSGGQKQRISIARAIVKDPSLLIFDDSLSAVDTNTETLILSNIKNVLKDKTGIIISHRVSSVMHADNIIVLDKGRIIEAGTHEELMADQGSYYNLYNVQTHENKKEVLA
jgi:ABC-type multidrug transport system, ATPase and permease components